MYVCEQKTLRLAKVGGSYVLLLAGFGNRIEHTIAVR